MLGWTTIRLFLCPPPSNQPNDGQTLLLLCVVLNSAIVNMHEHTKHAFVTNTSSMSVVNAA